MRTVLINPPLVLQRGDFLGSGIPYMPHGLAYLAAALKRHGFGVLVVDLFGEDPFSGTRMGAAVLQGKGVSAALKGECRDADAVFIYARSVMEFDALVEIIRFLRRDGVKASIIVFENAQAVIGGALSLASRELFDAGCEYLIVGDPEEAAVELLGSIREKRGIGPIRGVIARDAKTGAESEQRGAIADLDTLQYPAWEEFPLENYWRLSYAHGPMSGRYLALLTSRGCPYRCAFCAVPQTNRGVWRARSPENVVGEMAEFQVRFGVSEFHWEDLNPTVDRMRVAGICEGMIRRGLEVTWKLVSGTKIETLDEGTIRLMARAGCRYISFSPESGSPRVLKAMEKTFDFAHGLAMTRVMRTIGIRSQACFVIGFPRETAEDREDSAVYARELVSAGVDELAFFIMTPIPGAPAYGTLQWYDSLSQLSFSPAWRKDFKTLSRWRRAHYLRFLFVKTIRSPHRVLRQCANFLRRRFETKMEMTPYRAIHQWRIWRRAAARG